MVDIQIRVNSVAEHCILVCLWAPPHKEGFKVVKHCQVPTSYKLLSKSATRELSVCVSHFHILKCPGRAVTASQSTREASNCDELLRLTWGYNNDNWYLKTEYEDDILPSSISSRL
jgi:hypothetical protein